GGLLCDTDLEALWGDVGPFIGVERAKLQDALLSGAAVHRRLATSITALRQEGHCVAVEFSDGTTGTYDLVIGADGISSTVRRLAIGTALPVYSESRRAHRRCRTRKLPYDGPRRLHGDGGRLGAGGDPALDRRRGERPRHVRRSAHRAGQLGPAGKQRGGRSASLTARHPQHDPAGARREDAVAPVPTPDRASLAAGAFQPYSAPCH